jgi:hypothetical protein
MTAFKLRHQFICPLAAADVGGATVVCVVQDQVSGVIDDRLPSNAWLSCRLRP